MGRLSWLWAEGDIATYDAYGNVSRKTGTTQNDYRFAGEQYDSHLDQYYLRTRYYDSDSGRFTRRDVYEGKLRNPLTLHKYLYVKANPINHVDPTGLFAPGDGYAVEDAIEVAYQTERPWEFQFTQFSKKAAIPWFGIELPIFPDIMNYSGFMSMDEDGKGLFNEIKPLTYYGVTEGIPQITGYYLALEPYNFDPDVEWHKPSNPLILRNVPLVDRGPTDLLVFNVAGLLFYTDDLSRQMRQALLAITVSSTSYRDALDKARQLIPITVSNEGDELGRSKYLLNSANNTLAAVNYALIASLLLTVTLRLAW